MLVDFARMKLIVGTEPCEQHGCDALALVGFEWPGKPPSKACGRHGAWAHQIADALGFRLALTRLPSVKEIDLNPTDDPTELRARELEIDP